MAEVEVSEGIRLLKENIKFVNESFLDIQKQLNEPIGGDEANESFDTKILRLTLVQLIIPIKLLSETANDQLKILEVILNMINDQKKTED